MLKRIDAPLAFAIFAVALIVSVQLGTALFLTPPPQQETAEEHHIKTKSEKVSVADTAAINVAKWTKVLALLTIVLAGASIFQGIFLIRADKTARISAESARRSADALLITERCYPYPEIVNPGAIRECINDAIASENDPPNHIVIRLHETAEVSFKIKNYGKTPAILKSIFAGVGLYPVGVEFGMAIADGVLGQGEGTREFHAIMEQGLTPEEARGILSYERSMVLAGQLTFSDAWNKDFTLRFSFQWDIETRSWMLREAECTPVEDV